jgi:hypothetical protein
MADNNRNARHVTKRELREAAVQMTASPPVAANFIGFAPDAPQGYTPLVSPLGETMPATPSSESGSADGTAADR